MIKTPINQGILQSDLDFAGFNALHFSGGGGGSALGLVINVKSSPYNATGNGTTDDTVAVQGAINAVFAAGGGTVFFPRGTYLCNGAFDGTTNSILKIPMTAIGSNAMQITLMGEMPPVWVGGSGAATSMISTTKTGTGSGPALLGAGPYFGAGPQNENLFNNVMLTIRNFYFVSTTDTLNIVRLDSAGTAVIEDCVIGGGGSITSGIIGLTMPNTGNFAHLWANRVLVGGCAIALQTGEHFRSPMFSAGSCGVGCQFMYADESSQANFMFDHCKYFLQFVGGNHSVDLFLDLERAADGDTYATSVDVNDPSNYGTGVVRYKIVKGGGTGPILTPITFTGASKLQFTNLYGDGALTVATLPAASRVGQTACINDGAASLALGATVTGGGTAKYLVWWNGAAWTVTGK